MRTTSIAVVAWACGACWADDGFLIDAACMPSSIESETAHEITLFDHCRPCEEVRNLECHVEVNGADIDLWATLESKEIRGTCPDLCVWLEASCTIPALPEGDYTVHFDGHDGEWTRALTVRGTTSASACVSGGSYGCPPGCD